MIILLSLNTKSTEQCKRVEASGLFMDEDLVLYG